METLSAIMRMTLNLATISLTGNHFGSLQFIGSQVSKYDIAFVDKTLFAAAVLGSDYVLALAAVLGPELYFHQLKEGYASNFGINITVLHYPQPRIAIYILTSNLVSTAVPIIAAKTQPSTLPLPAPSGNFSISPNLATISEKDGSASFTITRTKLQSGSPPVYVSTVHDQGLDNPNGNTFYNGLFNKQVTFAAGARNCSNTVDD